MVKRLSHQRCVDGGSPCERTTDIHGGLVVQTNEAECPRIAIDDLDTQRHSIRSVHDEAIPNQPHADRTVQAKLSRSPMNGFRRMHTDLRFLPVASDDDLSGWPANHIVVTSPVEIPPTQDDRTDRTTGGQGIDLPDGFSQGLRMGGQARQGMHRPGHGDLAQKPRRIMPGEPDFLFAQVGKISAGIPGS